LSEPPWLACSSAFFINLTLLRNKHDFSQRARLENFSVRARSLGQRQLFAHHWAQRAVFQARNQPGMNVRFFRRCNPPKRERANRAASGHQFARIDGHFAFPAVPKTVSPMARAICTLALPTPPLAPCTSTVSDACAFAE